GGQLGAWRAPHAHLRRTGIRGYTSLGSRVAAAGPCRRRHRGTRLVTREILTSSAGRQDERAAPARAHEVGRTMPERDYYETLGVARDATPEAIKKAYRGLARKYHPAANPAAKRPEAPFKEAKHAYDILPDPERGPPYA